MDQLTPLINPTLNIPNMQKTHATSKAGKDLIAKIKGATPKRPRKPSKAASALPESGARGQQEDLAEKNRHLDELKRTLYRQLIATLDSKSLNSQEGTILKGLFNDEEKRLQKEEEIFRSNSATWEQRQQAYCRAVNGPSINDLVSLAKEYPDQVLSNIDQYLATLPDKIYNSLAWDVHYLLYEPGRTTPETEDMEFFFERLWIFLCRPDISKLLYEEMPWADYQGASGIFDRLGKFFKKMQEDRNEAEMDRLTLKMWTHKFEYGTLHGWNQYYERKNKIAQAVAAIDSER